MRLREDPFLANEPVDEEGSWAISYGDMITVLMSFFILYFSMDPKNHDDKQLANSLVLALSDKSENTSAISKTREPAQINDDLSLGDDPEGSGVDEKWMDIMGARITKMGSKLIVEFPEVSFFHSGAIDLRDEAIVVLRQFSGRYLPYAGKYQLGVQAYTDKTPVRYVPGRRFKDNLELSALRSVAAMRILQQAGVPIQNMKLSGYGEFLKVRDAVKQYQPSDQDGLARKVVLVVEPKDEEVPDAGA